MSAGRSFSLTMCLLASASCVARQTVARPEQRAAPAPSDSHPPLASPERAAAPRVAAGNATPVASPAAARVAQTLPAVQLPQALAHVSFQGSSGRDCDHPALIIGAKNEVESAAAQRAWLAAVYPGLRPYEHALTKRDGRMLDAYSLKQADGGLVYACFDITATLGQW